MDNCIVYCKQHSKFQISHKKGTYITYELISVCLVINRLKLGARIALGYPQILSHSFYHHSNQGIKSQCEKKYSFIICLINLSKLSSIPKVWSRRHYFCKKDGTVCLIILQAPLIFLKSGMTINFIRHTVNHNFKHSLSVM